MMIGIDFDGTICEDPKDGYPLIGATIPFAVETLKALHAKGHSLFVWSLRCHESRALRPLLEWIDANKLHGVLRFEPVHPYGKPPFEMFIDDRNFGGFPGWAKVAAHFDIVESVFNALDGWEKSAFKLETKSKGTKQREDVCKDFHRKKRPATVDLLRAGR